ncbi:MAG: thiamine phosphate synthase [Acidobacteria bacterium]|nr:MAG: thiamine phosphate synthase [Acidobacteriota bacterium]
MRIFATISEKRNLTAPFWYGISARSFFPGLDPFQYLEALFRTNAHVVQWREKDLPADVLRPLVRFGSERAVETGKIFLINSATWAALLESADGVHLTSTGSVTEAVRARRQSGRSEFLIGKSVHSVDEAIRAAAEGADYLLLGPVFDPLSKGRQLAPIGLDVLRSAVRQVQVPIFALGGIDRTNAELVLETGVAGVAGISWVKEEIEARMR